MQIRIAGHICDGTGVVTSPGTAQFHAALDLYRERFPGVHYRPGDQLVVITLHTESQPG